MNPTIQFLTLLKISKLNLLLSLILCLTHVMCWNPNEIEGLLGADVPWAFSPPALMYLVEKERELYSMMKDHQPSTKSEELVNR